MNVKEARSILEKLKGFEDSMCIIVIESRKTAGYNGYRWGTIYFVHFGHLCRSSDTLEQAIVEIRNAVEYVNQSQDPDDALQERGEMSDETLKEIVEK